MKKNIRLLYLYLFSFVGLIVIVFGSIRLIDLALRTTVFKGSDVYTYVAPRRIDCAPDEECEDVDQEEYKMQAEEDAKHQRQRDLSNSLAMIIVGTPLYLYHWGIIKKEK